LKRRQTAGGNVVNELVHNLRLETLTLAPLTPTIGAEVSGIDLSWPLEPPLKAALRQALLDWKVLFFRDQDITTEQHLAFARAFGELEVHPFAPSKPLYPEVLAITHDRDSRGR
jgi:taurine dioxygenase